MTLRIAIAKPDWGIFGGYELLMSELARRLEQRGHTISWMLPRVDELGSYAYGHDLGRLFSVVPEYARFVQLVERFSSLDLDGADVVVSAMPGAYAVRHPRHITVFSHHLRSYYDLADVLVEAQMVANVEAHRHAAERVHDIDTLYLGSTPLILATSPEVAGRLKRFNGLEHNVDVMLAGLGFQGAVPAPSSEDDFAHVLCVSRHEFPKRTELFVQAASLIRGVDSISVGAGGRLGWSMSIASELATGARDPSANGRKLWCSNAPWIDPDSIDRARIHSAYRLGFTGHVAPSELDLLYRRSLCVVAPAYLEDYGLTAIEAMAYGKPLIVCNDGGNLVNFVEHGINGFVVEPDGTAIAEAVQRLVDDRSLAAKMGAAARETARPYTWDRAMWQFQAALDEVLAA